MGLAPGISMKQVAFMLMLASRVMGLNDTFTSCAFEGTCSGRCGQLLNDGTVGLCYDLTVPCFCFTDGVECERSSHCNRTESCVKILPSSQTSYCVRCEHVVRREPALTYVDDDQTCETPEPVPTPYPLTPFDDSGNPCDNSTMCAGYCGYLDTEGKVMRPCGDRTDCFCNFPYPCEGSLECRYGTACAPYKQGSTHKYCLSCATIGAYSNPLTPVDDLHACGGGKIMSSDTDISEEVCVGIAHIAHLPRSRLVFPEHRRASVLCDPFGTCATPGHMVLFEGRAMMMRTYCDYYLRSDQGGQQQQQHARCSKRVTWVNSPRMQFNLRIHTNSPGLVITPLAAAFGTVAEEQVLRIVARLTS